MALCDTCRYWKRLAGFQKVHMPAGKTVVVSIEINPDDELAVYTTSQPGSPLAGTRKVIKGEYRVSVGGSSDTDITTTTFAL